MRYAVVGLGYIAQIAVLPAFAHARNSRLAALVSDDPVKLRKLGRKYGVELRASYVELPGLLRGGEIDAVYIALPNSMHAETTRLAARAGIHVLCEKPMAVTSAECERMLEDVERAGVQLMIAYRLHFERATLTAIETGRSGKLGELRTFTSDFTMPVRDEDNIRLQGDLGGGTLHDIGIYCINAARGLFRSEPVQAFAVGVSGRDRRFREVDETVAATLVFPEGRTASFTCSFGAADVSSYRLTGTKGSLRVEPAYEYAEALEHHLTIGERTTSREFPRRDQFAPELVHFSKCVLEDREPSPSGEEGAIDVRIIEALEESIRGGRAVDLDLEPPARRPDARNEMRRAPVKKPALVRTRPPSAG